MNRREFTSVVNEIYIDLIKSPLFKINGDEPFQIITGDDLYFVITKRVVTENGTDYNIVFHQNKESLSNSFIELNLQKVNPLKAHEWFCALDTISLQLHISIPDFNPDIHYNKPIEINLTTERNIPWFPNQKLSDENKLKVLRLMGLIQAFAIYLAQENSDKAESMFNPIVNHRGIIPSVEFLSEEGSIGVTKEYIELEPTKIKEVIFEDQDQLSQLKEKKREGNKAIEIVFAPKLGQDKNSEWRFGVILYDDEDGSIGTILSETPLYEDPEKFARSIAECLIRTDIVPESLEYREDNIPLVFGDLFKKLDIPLVKNNSEEMAEELDNFESYVFSRYASDIYKDNEEDIEEEEDIDFKPDMPLDLDEELVDHIKSKIGQIFEQMHGLGSNEEESYLLVGDINGDTYEIEVFDSDPISKLAEEILEQTGKELRAVETDDYFIESENFYYNVQLMDLDELEYINLHFDDGNSFFQVISD